MNMRRASDSILNYESPLLKVASKLKRKNVPQNDKYTSEIVTLKNSYTPKKIEF